MMGMRNLDSWLPRHPGLRVVPFLVLAFCVLSGQYDPSRVKPLAGPYYNPETKSYFLLIDYRASQDGSNWWTAKEVARRMTFGGTNGRLAIVRTPQTHDFLVKHFRTRGNAWIGLRYDCSERRPVWIDGTELEPSDFSVWDLTRWYNNRNITCDNAPIKFMGVFYLSTRELFRWRAAGEQKHWRYAIIEFPTGKKVDE